MNKINRLIGILCEIRAVRNQKWSNAVHVSMQISSFLLVLIQVESGFFITLRQWKAVWGGEACVKYVHSHVEPTVVYLIHSRCRCSAPYSWRYSSVCEVSETRHVQKHHALNISYSIRCWTGDLANFLIFEVDNNYKMNILEWLFYNGNSLWPDY